MCIWLFVLCLMSKVPRETQLSVLFLRNPAPGGTPVTQGDSYTPTTVVTVFAGCLFFVFFPDDAASVVLSALWSPQQTVLSYSKALHR